MYVQYVQQAAQPAQSGSVSPAPPCEQYSIVARVRRTYSTYYYSVLCTGVPMHTHQYTVYLVYCTGIPYSMQLSVFADLILKSNIAYFKLTADEITIETVLISIKGMDYAVNVIPGDVVGDAGSFTAGNGVYISVEGASGDKTVIRASVTGKVIFGQEVNGIKEVSVISPCVCAREYIVEVGDIIVGRVLRTTVNQAFVEILSVGDRLLYFTAKGFIRREDILQAEIDKVVVGTVFKPNDIVRATVISLGDSNNYYLSTASGNLGVVVRPEDNVT